MLQDASQWKAASALALLSSVLTSQHPCQPQASSTLLLSIVQPRCLHLGREGCVGHTATEKVLGGKESMALSGLFVFNGLVNVL